MDGDIETDDRQSELDFVVLIVEDLEQARINFERLGFNLTPCLKHETDYKTFFHQIILEDTYLEVVKFDAEGTHKPNPGPKKTKDGGIGGVVFKCQNAAQRHYELMRQGFNVSSVHHPKRPQISNSDTILEFQIFCAVNENPDLWDCYYCQHKDRDATMLPDWSKHPNGARSFLSITTIQNKCDHIGVFYERLLGPGSTFSTKEYVNVLCDDNVQLVFMTPEYASGQYAHVCEGLGIETLNQILQIQVYTLETLETVLIENSYPYYKGDGDIYAAMSHGGNNIIRFSEQ